MCADQDVQFYIGQAHVLNGIAARSRNCIYFGKKFQSGSSRNSARYQLLDTLLSNGCRMLFLDEEGGLFKASGPEYEAILRDRMLLDQLTRDDTMLLWGEHQKSVLEKSAPSSGPRVAVTGHPRFDLAKPHFSELYAPTAQLRKLGRYILFNGSFGFANHVQGDHLGHYVSQLADTRRVPNTINTWAEEHQQFALFLQAAEFVARERPDLTLVIRPHPSESADVYQKVFMHYDNIIVEHGSNDSVLTWINQATAVVHAGCTTGIEAKLAGVPVVCLRGTGNKNEQEWEMVGDYVAHDAASAADAILGVVDHGSHQQFSFPPSVENLVSNLNRNSLDQIASLLDESLATIGQSDLRDAAVVVRPPSLWSQLKRRGRHMLRGKPPAFKSHKFVPFNREDLKVRLDRTARIVGRCPNWRMINSQLFVVGGMTRQKHAW
jgi:surface carbohydrate biosynthesis protein